MKTYRKLKVSGLGLHTSAFKQPSITFASCQYSYHELKLSSQEEDFIISLHQWALPQFSRLVTEIETNTSRQSLPGQY
jgi:hypothetical protein